MKSREDLGSLLDSVAVCALVRSRRKRDMLLLTVRRRRLGRHIAIPLRLVLPPGFGLQSSVIAGEEDRSRGQSRAVASPRAEKAKNLVSSDSWMLVHVEEKQRHLSFVAN